MFDGTVEQFPVCSSQRPVTFVARACGDLITLETWSLYGGGACYYDATSHALAGAEGGSDVAQFCGNTSPSIFAGRTPGSCTSEPIAMKDCRSQP